MKRLRVIDGANINFTGIREKGIYGEKTYDFLKDSLSKKSRDMGLDIEIFQSNHEGEIIDYLQKCYHDKIDGIIINAGAFTHYSYAIADAISSISMPVIEVHISNIYAREDFRKKSVIASVCSGQITGMGIYGYELALYAMKNILGC